MATKIRPIVFKIDEPEGFVMNASNVADIGGNSSGMYVSWEGPDYPNGYDGNGKHYILVNNNPNSGVFTDYGLMYARAVEAGGPQAIKPSEIEIRGQSEGTLDANQAGTANGYGKYLNLILKKNEGSIGVITLEDVQAYVANLTITILDP